MPIACCLLQATLLLDDSPLLYPFVHLLLPLEHAHLVHYVLALDEVLYDPQTHFCRDELQVCK